MDEEKLDKGDWIVHKQHGVGQIKAVEEKTIGDSVRQYFRVDVSGGVYWLPTTDMPDYVRPVSSHYKFRKVLKLIREAPAELPQEYKERDRKIAERLEDPALESKGKLIRDLHARKQTEGAKLSALNERQLDGLRIQFLAEMVIVLDVEMREAEDRLDKALKKSLVELTESS